MERSRQRAVWLFAFVLACVALANGLGSSIFSNYFKEIFQVTSAQRGFLEIPRESPGILCMVVVAALGGMGSVWLSVLAQGLMLAGLVVMGFLSPGYGVMLVFLFLHSLGQHLFMPLSDSISMELAKNGQVGAALGRFKGVTTLVSMLSACLVFVGFRTGLFSFHTKIILPFVIAAAAAAAAAVLLVCLRPLLPQEKGVANHKLLFRRAYMPYYMVTLAYGCQKRIRIVFAPWVIIELLRQGADTVALLTIATHLVGSAVAPVIGRMLDKLGVRRMLLVEAGYIAVTFCAMGLLAGQLSSGSFGAAGWQTWVVYGVYVLCVLFEQFNMVHSFMMRSIAVNPDEVTRTLSVGLSVDHVMAVLASPVLGLVWTGLGVQYVFYLSALSVAFQVAAAVMVRDRALS